MSHISTIATTLTDEKMLREALQNLGYIVSAEKRIPTYYAGQTVPVDVAFRIPDSPRALGFKRQANGTFALTGDTWGFGNKAPSVKDITLRYNQRIVANQMKKKRMSLVKTEKTEDGKIIEVYRGF